MRIQPTQAISTVVLGALLLLGAGPGWALTPTEVAKLIASDGAPADRFGISVAVAGDTAVIGARSDDGADTNSGSVYVFTRSDGIWTEVAKLTASDGVVGDEFGFSVALAGDTAVIGANGDDDDVAGPNSGSAYVFSLGGDSDGDGVLDNDDNCPTVFNPDQLDTNVDGFGDACVSTSATIDPSATLGANPVIGDGTVIDKNVVIGDNAQIGSDVTLNKDIIAGDNFVVGDGTVIKKDVVILNDVQIGAEVSIAKNVMIGNGVKIGLTCPPPDPDPTTFCTSIGQNTTIADGVTIGMGVNIGQGSTINGDVPDSTTLPDGSVFP